MVHSDEPYMNLHVVTYGPRLRTGYILPYDISPALYMHETFSIDGNVFFSKFYEHLN